MNTALDHTFGRLYQNCIRQFRKSVENLGNRFTERFGQYGLFGRYLFDSPVQQKNKKMVQNLQLVRFTSTKFYLDWINHVLQFRKCCWIKKFRF